jgi:hypothetical protein
MSSYSWVEGTRCKRKYRLNKTTKMCDYTGSVSNPTPVPNPIHVSPSPDILEYPWTEGTRCKRKYKLNKSRKMCVYTKSKTKVSPPPPVPVPNPGPIVHIPEPPPGKYAIPVSVSFPTIKNNGSEVILPPLDNIRLFLPNASATESKQELFKILTVLFDRFNPYDKSKLLRIQYNLIQSLSVKDIESKRQYLGAELFTNYKDIPMDAVTITPNNRLYVRVMAAVDPLPAPPKPIEQPKPVVHIPEPPPGKYAIPVSVSFSTIKKDGSDVILPPNDNIRFFLPTKSIAEGREILFKILTDLFNKFNPYDKSKLLRVQYNFINSLSVTDIESKRQYLEAGLFTNPNDIPVEAVTLGQNKRLYIRVMSAVDPLPPAPPPGPLPVPVPKPPEAIEQIIQIARTGDKCPDTFKYNKTTKMCEKCPTAYKKVGRTCVLLPTDDEKTKDEVGPPAPLVVLPVPPAAKGESLRELLDRLEDTGKKIVDPSYTSGRWAIFIYIYLIKKYAASCSIFNDVFHLHGAGINYDINTKQLQVPKNLGEQMRECILRGSELIFIMVYMTTKKSAHVNLLIYRPFKKIVERYEPHGRETGWRTKEYSEFDLNKQLKELFEETVHPVLREYTPVFKTPTEICPAIGFQGIEGLLPKDKKEGGGYCQLWIMFMMETILLNPTLNTENIIEECIIIGKNNPGYFRNLIRGYTHEIAKEIKVYFARYIKHDIGTEIAQHAFNQINVQLLIDQTLVETKQRSQPLPAIGEAPTSLSVEDVREIQREVDKVSAAMLYIYSSFIHYKRILTHIDNTQLTARREELKKLLMSRVIKWSTLMENMYNTYFTQTIPLHIKNYDYFIRFGKYPQPNISLIHVPIKDRMQLMQEVKAVFPNWHKFYETIIKQINSPVVFTPKDLEKVEKEVKKLSQQQVSEYLYLLVSSKPAEPSNKKGQYFDKTLHNEHVVTLTQQLKAQHLHVADMKNWMSMF